MTGNPNHHICVHGHFYQPPRENPWLGVIEPQDSAFPYQNWNERIAAESYTALSCSPVKVDGDRTGDLFNCYAHMSFNFGPTLNEWLEKTNPALLSRIALADDLARQSYNGNGAAMAQAYNHTILPLCDARDRHTQIVWGLREFQHRFNRDADSIWLPETAINMDTVRALIDHGIKYVILSPLQAAYVRPFGQGEWIGVPDGTIETRHPYRIFEVDGAGRTHFDRHLDVFFYDKDLSTRVSFDHLLSDAQRLEWFARQRLDDTATLPQLVLIATDGEIYGHHEKHGNRALAYFFHQLLQRKNILLTNLTLYLEENPPCWEVKLWEGLDGKGSSWSCSHGVSRWESDCGCGDGPHDWNQQWRTPLRQAFDELRGQLRKVFRREMGGLVFDAYEARNDYIRVLLEPTPLRRTEYLQRHTQRELTSTEQVRFWQLLEMDRYAMLMYTSCGWFFCELSGLEPVQNMRYALRAAELGDQLEGYTGAVEKGTLVARLRERLTAAESNLPEHKNGREIFDRHVLGTRYTTREIAAVHALSLLLDLPEPEYAVTCEITEEIKKSGGKGIMILQGRANCRDNRTGQRENLSLVAIRMPDGRAGVGVFADLARGRELAGLSPEAILRELEKEGIPLVNLPFADRQRIFACLHREELVGAEHDLVGVYSQFKPLLEKMTGQRLPLPESLRVAGEQALAHRLLGEVRQIAAKQAVTPVLVEAVQAVFAEGSRCGLRVERAAAARLLATALAQKLESLMTHLTLEEITDALEFLRFCTATGFTLDNMDMLQDRFWRVLHLSPRPTPTTRTIVDRTRELGAALGFDQALLKKQTQLLFSTPV